MRELRKNVDEEVCFTELKEAKKWYLPKDNVPCTKEEYLGNCYEFFFKEFA